MNHHLIHAARECAKASREARDRGDSNKAIAFVLIGFGIVTLPIPIIGIPLIICGIVKLFK